MSQEDATHRDAVSAWRRCLGDGAVLTTPDVLRRYGRGDYQAAPSPLAVLRVQDRDQVVAAVRIAAEFRVGVHPISRGHNWGYGAATPVGPGQVVLDMGGMNKVVAVDDDLAYAVVEPGVTQRQLFRCLADDHPQLIMDATDAPSGSSIVGNCLERGIGFSAAGYRIANCCGMEVVLADGTVVETGYAGLGATRLSHTRRWGVGPNIEGLFSQSNLGVVTKLGVWLMPKPESILTYWIVAESDEKFIDALQRLRSLMLSGGLSTVVHAGNWFGDEGWLLFGGLYGSRELVAYARSAMSKALREAGVRVHFIDPSDARWQRRAVGEMAAALPPSAFPGGRSAWMRMAARAAGFVGYLKPFEPLLQQLSKFVRILSGEPLDEAIFPSGHVPLDSDADTPRRHVTITATCNNQRADVVSMLSLLRSRLQRHGRKERLWCAVQEARSVSFIQHLFYAREDAREEADALRCYEDIWGAAFERGFFPYRVANRSMSRLDVNATSYWQTVRRVKRALDPLGILAPGKYLPDREEPPR